MESQDWGTIIGDSHDIAAETLNKKSTLRHLTSGTILIHQDEEIDHVYLVTAGSFEVVTTEMDGSEIWLADLQFGEIVGEVSALYSHSSTSSVLARAPSEVLAVSRSDFLYAMDSSGKFARAVASLLAERIAKTSEHLSNKVSKSVQNRLRQYLISLALTDAESNQLKIKSAPPVAEICDRIHATREATSRAMTNLQKSKIVKRVNGEIIVLKP